MLTTQRKQFIELARPRSFVGLMSLYDNNYRRLQRLLGGYLPEPGRSLVSRVPGDVALYIDGLERSRFTHTFRLTYLFEDVPEPDLVVRVYHDARLAEAMNSGGMQQRWMRNLMLNKWLEYCHERGHRFGPIEVAVREPIDVGLR
jgi:uncharacterized protein